MSAEKKILVVEDNDFIRMQIKGFLQAGNYTVIEASDGKAALALVQDNVAVSIVDVRMEPMGGFEFIRSIRSMGIDVPVVMITGDNDPDLLTDSTKNGAMAMLMKPIQKDRLLKTVERAIMVAERSA